MLASDAPQSGDQRPKRLLTQNREMKTIGAWNWSLPAWAGRLADGRTYNTCPSAGICRHVCYALNGTYRWPVVRARHHANLAFVLDDLAGWEHAMTAELGAAKFRSVWIRIHDAGDFFSDFSDRLLSVRVTRLDRSRRRPVPINRSGRFCP
jgi:hypothetical protein